ncbi:hypothetical protein SBI_05843 [Streptomyces bingchenggensis BCW-1]|uniref:Uncharacterized protein n=1 Tax=Streptomyces bingchenggensis (strain BCW-1) TaxID=749414 RepID=D7CG59_STRBB|nr:MULTISPECIES: DUF6415 family natural product biosynthesis protein [Streptomyces]ADI08963.1 hypothetical protein SBI_05843 [Streptomyces bingchenggensis BCW-1]
MTVDDVDVCAIEKTIARAVVKRTALPPYEELCELHDVLVEHIKALVPLADKRINRLNRGTVDWYQKRSRLDLIPHELRQGLGSGLQSADWHVRSLGYTCHFLLDNSGVTSDARSMP